MSLKNRKRTVLLLAALVFAAGAWGAFLHLRAAAQLARVKALRDQVTESARNLPAPERRALFGQLREEVQKLPPDQRRQLWGDRRGRFREDMEKYFKLSKEEKTAYLDDRLRRMEEARKEFEQNRSQNGQGGPQAGARGWAGRGGTPEEREQRRKEFLDRTTPEDRAMMSEFRKELNERRQQLGLPPGGWGPGGHR
jgi:hypothetical protein